VAAGATSTFDAAGYFSDPDGDELTYSAGSSNEAAATISMDGSSATITGVADGTAVVTITARDPDGAAAAQSVSVTVGDGVAENRSPVAVGTIPAHDVDVGGAISIRLGAYFSDPDGDALTYGAESSNADAASTSVEGATVTISGVADGKAVVTVTASDPDGESAAQTVSVTIGDGDSSNASPVAVGTIPDHSVGIGGTVNVDVTGYFSDADGDELSYMASSSNADVATASMEGTTVTIEGVGAGETVITVTASDGGATAAQGFNVAVAAAPPNNPPVAVGTIPGSSLQIGGTSTIDAAGYFSDADGDELAYAAASSNEGVATVSMDGSTATITAVATGDAVITITASDGSASVAQGFRIDVAAGPKAATVVITRLLDADRQQISDPSGISGTIYVVLDVESNDETWTDIGLTLGGETVTPMCRGSASADVAVGPGLAAAGQAEIECQLTTNAVVGECVGMQLDPKYANGDYQLGAFLTTDADERRAAIAPLPISLGNHGFVMIAHVPGSQSELGAHTSGLTFYGGPNAEGNVNQFHACPVAYDGTVVGKMRLSTRHTDTSRPTPEPVEGATSLSFRESRFGPDYPSKEAPFTWSAGTQWWNPNNSLENIPGGDDASETRIVNDGQILDPNGLDVTATFRAGGEEAMLGPLHFDFKAPAISDASAVVVATSNNPTTWESTTATFYRDGSGGSTRRFRITEMADMGVGHVYGATSAIAVGDYSADRNADGNPNTAFTPLGGLENVTLINELPEEDDTVDGVADGGGVDTYVAEVQSLADRLGNGAWLGGGRIRTASTFGVDRTAPVISRERPSEALVLSSNSLFFEVEDPRLGTGEDGSGLARNVLAWAGSSNPNSGQVYWRASGTTVAANGSVEIDIDPAGNARFAREASHTVYAATPDVAGNYASTAFTFVRDQSDPVLSLSAVPNDFGSITAKSVSVGVAGTLNDATEIRRAFLSIHHGTTCTADDPLEASQVSGPVRRLDNDSNSIEFSEVFTVKQGDDNGVTDYCFFLHAEDDARDADDRADANSYSEVISTFNVTWREGAPPPAAGPTFEFFRNDALVTLLEAVEGSTDSTYFVGLKDEKTPATPEAPISVNIIAEAGIIVDPTTLSFDGTVDSLEVTVTAVQDLDIASQTGTVTHSATDFADGEFMVKSLDEDFEITAAPGSIREDDGPTEVTVTVNAGEAADVENAVTVTLAAATGAETDDIDSGSAGTAEVTVDPMTRTGEAKVMVNAVDDAERDEVGESISLTASVGDAHVEPASIMIVDDDPDITLSLSQDEVDEDAGAVTVTITATADAPVNGVVTLTLALSGTATGGTDYENPDTVTLTINARGTTGTTDVTLTITEDATDESNETIIFDDADGATVGDKTYTTSKATLTIIDNDDT
jgi:hypothetical protein